LTCCGQDLPRRRGRLRAGSCGTRLTSPERKWRQYSRAVLTRRNASGNFYASPRYPTDVESVGLCFVQAFAADIQQQISAAATSRSPGSLVHEIEQAILTFPSNLGTAAASKCEEIDNTATVLWNLCTRLRRDNESETPQDSPAVLDIARVFAFLLLCCAHGHGKPTRSNICRLMKIGFKAAKGSIGMSPEDDESIC
jgi:hypothetical protein